MEPVSVRVDAPNLPRLTPLEKEVESVDAAVASNPRVLPSA